MLLSLCVMAASACCSIVGYALLAHAGHANELRAIGWLCAALVGTSQLCSALSIFSAIMLDIGTPALWLMLFVRTAQFTSVLSIVANIVQALCFILLLFAVQRGGRNAACVGRGAARVGRDAARNAWQRSILCGEGDAGNAVRGSVRARGRRGNARRIKRTDGRWQNFDTRRSGRCRRSHGKVERRKA